MQNERSLVKMDHWAFRILSPGILAWVGWVSFTLIQMGQDIAVIKQELQSIVPKITRSEPITAQLQP